MLDWKQIVRERLARLRLAPEREAEIVEELALDLEQRYSDALVRGALHAAALQAALVELENSERVAQAIRDAEFAGVPRPLQKIAAAQRESAREIAPGRQRSNMLANLWQDLRYGLRMLAQNPGFTLAAILTLAVAIGANGAIFNLANAMLLRPPPAPDPEQLLRIHTLEASGARRRVISHPNFRDFREAAQGFSGIAATVGEVAISRHGAASELLSAELVTGNYFDVMGVGPLLGRTFRADDDKPGASRAVILGYLFWRRQFSGDPAIVGKPLDLNGELFTVIGVMPEEFTGDSFGAVIDVWVPLQQAARWIGPDWLERRDQARLHALARLAPDVQLLTAQASLSTVAQRLAKIYPDLRVQHVKLERARYFDSGLREPVAAFFGILLGVVALVLLTACANLANLLLVRATGRTREIAVRLALGAGYWRVVRQFMTESLLLAACGGLAGLFLSLWASRLILGLNPLPASIPIHVNVEPDVRLAVFLILASLVTGALLALAPALHMRRTNLVNALKGDAAGAAGSRSRLRRALITAQVAVSLVLLIAAGLFLRSLQNARNIPLGFEPRGAIALDFDNISSLQWSRGRIEQFYRQLLRRVHSLPGVESAALMDLAPLDLATPRSGINLPGDAMPATGKGLQHPQISFNRVSPGYFHALRIPLAAGRDFTEHDDARAPSVAIVNETMAQRFWPGEPAVGRRFHIAGNNPRDPLMPGVVEVVAVARNVKYRTLGEAQEAHFYVPFTQHHTDGRALVVRGSDARPSAYLIPIVQAEVQSLENTVRGFFARTLIEHSGLALLPARVAAILAAVFGAVALLLVTTGLYGVVAYSVAQRTREIGIRMALGARPRDVLQLVMGQGARLIALGIALGLAGAFLLTRFLNNLLYGLSATDPLTFAGVALLLGLVALVACVVPARRATRVDPLTALRHE